MLIMCYLICFDIIAQDSKNLFVSADYWEQTPNNIDMASQHIMHWKEQIILLNTPTITSDTLSYITLSSIYPAASLSTYLDSVAYYKWLYIAAKNGGVPANLFSIREEPNNNPFSIKTIIEDYWAWITIIIALLFVIIYMKTKD